MTNRHGHRFRWSSMAALMLFGACGGEEAGQGPPDAGAEAGDAGSSAASGGAGGSHAGSGQGGNAGKGAINTGGNAGRDGGEAGEGSGGGSGKAGSGGVAGRAGSSGMSGTGGTAGSNGSGGSPPVAAPGFTDAAVLAPGVSALEDPKLVMNQAGDALVAWVGYAGARQGIWVLHYDAEAAAWSEPTEINTDERYDATLDDVALDEAGNAYVVWTQGFIFVTRYDEEAAEWQDAFQIEDHDEGGSGFPRIAVGPGGTASIVWSESDGSRSSVRNRRYDPEADEWSFWEPIDDAELRNSDQCAIAVDSAGNAIAAFSQSGDSGVEGGPLVANVFDADAGMWGEPVVLSPESGESAPVGMTLAAGPEGSFFLVWAQYQSELGGDTRLLARRFTASSGWGDTVPLETQVALTTTLPRLALDMNGNATVIWTADDGLWSVRYGAAEDAWSEPTRLEDLAGWVAKWSSVAMDAAGNTLAVSAQWPARDINLDVDAVVNARAAGAVEWGPVQLLENHTGAAFGPVVGLGADGDGFVVWRRDNEADLWFSRYERE